MALQSTEINQTRIIFDREKTKEYRTEFNKPCDCQNCRNFYKHIENNTELTCFLRGFGIDYRCDEDVFSWDWGDDINSLVHHEGYYGVFGSIEGEDFDFEMYGVKISFQKVASVPNDRTGEFFWICIEGDFSYILDEERELPSSFSQKIEKIKSIFGTKCDNWVRGEMEKLHNESFKHTDPDEFHDKELSLHDCVSDNVSLENGILRFNLPDGLWVTPCHKDSGLEKTVRTGPAAVEFTIGDPEDISVRLFTRHRWLWFRKTSVENIDLEHLISAVNSGKCTIEFIYQYRSCVGQLWVCAVHSRKKRYYRECQLFLPEAKSTFLWNDLMPDREW